MTEERDSFSFSASEDELKPDPPIFPPDLDEDHEKLEDYKNTDKYDKLIKNRIKERL